MASTDVSRTDLLSAVLKAYGGESRFNEIKSIEVKFNLSGLLFDSKGYPGHRQPKAIIDPRSPKVSFTGLESRADEHWEYLPHKTWIENDDGEVTQYRDNPRAAFAQHAENSPWDDMHLLYFTGYAMWNYLTAPFSFRMPGVRTRELQDHYEDGDRLANQSTAFNIDAILLNQFNSMQFNPEFQIT